MTTQNILKKLYKINENTNNVDLINLIKDLESELMIQDFKGASSKQRLTKAMNWHKAMLKKPRPALAYSADYKEYQAVTDSYMIAFMINEDKTAIPNVNTTKMSYPNLELIDRRIQKMFDEGINMKDRIDLKVIYNLLKTKSNIVIKNQETNKMVGIDKQVFNNLVLFLNIKDFNNDIELITIDDFQMNIKMKSGTYGTLCFQRILNENEINESDIIYY